MKICILLFILLLGVLCGVMAGALFMLFAIVITE